MIHFFFKNCVILKISIIHTNIINLNNLKKVVITKFELEIIYTNKLNLTQFITIYIYLFI